MLTVIQGHDTALLTLVFVAVLGGALMFFSAWFLYELGLFSLPDGIATRFIDLLWKLLPRQFQAIVVYTVKKLTFVANLVCPKEVHFFFRNGEINTCLLSVARTIASCAFTTREPH